MRKSLAVAAVLAALASTPVLAQTPTQQAPYRPAVPLYQQAPGTRAPATAPYNAQPYNAQPYNAQGNTAAPYAPQPYNSRASSKAPLATPMGQIVNINTGSEAQLDSLPQIGKVRAQKIMNGRPYNTPEDLVTKRVLSQGIFNKIRDRITVR